MHAARLLQPGLGAVAAPAANNRTKKGNRLDLLARVINLRADCVEQAFSAPAGSERDDSRWEDLYEQAEDLGRDWAINDPTDARLLLPSLLPELPDITNCFEDGYDEVARLGGLRESEDPCLTWEGSANQHLTAICDACYTDFSVRLDDIADNKPAVTCPCCGQVWGQ